jgi:hypothetical protein
MQQDMGCHAHWNLFNISGTNTDGGIRISRVWEEIIYFTTLSASNTTRRRMMRGLVSNELERILKEKLMASMEIIREK